MNNSMDIQPPGTILQHLYIKERLRLLRPGFFIEIGTGQGYLSKLLLDAGWMGCGYELNEKAAAFASELNEKAIAAGNYKIFNGNWLNESNPPKADLIISCAVLEHLDEESEIKYLIQSKKSLMKNGVIIIIVPSSTKHWGIEDEIAGHYRRYTFESIEKLAAKNNLEVKHIAGLTYPISNLLLPISNYIVKKAEAQKKYWSINKRTENSGFRNVNFKTRFPTYLKFLLNEKTMLPFHFIQKLFFKNSNALIIYAEMSTTKY